MLFSVSCSFSYDNPPYLIKGEMVLDKENYDSFSTFAFEFLNKSDKSIKSFTLVFYLFDEDGNPPVSGRPNIVNTIKHSVGPGDRLESSFSLDRYINLVPENPWLVDYLYVSLIEYDDGTVWKDPFGLKS